jgi:hypothetical protein
MSSAKSLRIAGPTRPKKKTRQTHGTILGSDKRLLIFKDKSEQRRRGRRQIKEVKREGRGFQRTFWEEYGRQGSKKAHKSLLI